MPGSQIRGYSAWPGPGSISTPGATLAPIAGTALAGVLHFCSLQPGQTPIPATYKIQFVHDPQFSACIKFAAGALPEQQWRCSGVKTAK